MSILDLVQFAYFFAGFWWGISEKRNPLKVVGPFSRIRIRLADIGRQSGASPEEIARTIAIALTEETAKVVARTQGERLLRKGTEKLLNKYLGK